MLGQASALAVTCWVTHLKPDLLWVWAVHLLRAGWLCSCVAPGSNTGGLEQLFSTFLMLRPSCCGNPQHKIIFTATL